MRTPLRLVTLLVLPVALVSGCVVEPPPTPTPTTPPAPRFASDEEALAAAEEAYGAYLAVSDQVIRDGGTQPDRLKAFVSDPVYAEELKGMQRLADNGWRGVGHTSFTLILQQFDEETLTAYSCDDVSQTDLIDATGASVVKPDRQTLLPFEVEFDLGDSFRVVDKVLWNGGGVC